MTLLVIAAMSEERRCIEVLLTNPQPISDTRMPAVQGTIGNATVLLSESGIGKVNAALTASEFITRFHPDGVISTGVAGGLQPGLHVMDVVAASSIVYHDAYCGDENEPGQIQGMPARFAADARFLEAARALPAACRVSTGLQTSGDWFVTSRENTSHHTHIRSGCNRFCHIAGIFDTAVGDNRNTIFLCRLIAVHNCRNLGNTNTCNYTCRTNGSRSDSNLYSIHTGLNQSLCSCACSHIARNHLQIRVFFFYHSDRPEDVCRMSVSGIHHNNVHFCLYKLFHAFQAVCSNTDCRAAEQPALGVLRRQRVFNLFFNILDCDKTFQISFIIHDRKFFFSCFCKKLLRFLKGNSLFCRDQTFGRHGFFYFLGEVFLKFQITVCNNTDQLASFCNRHT